MKSLNKTATEIFLLLVDGLSGHTTSRKVDNAPGLFMPIVVERLEDDPEIYSLAHYYEMNGDLVPDPDAEFLVVRGTRSGGEVVGIYPVAIDQGPLGYRRYAQPEGGGRVRVTARGQAELAEFCNQWMSNVADQQQLLVRLASSRKR